MQRTFRVLLGLVGVLLAAPNNAWGQAAPAGQVAQRVVDEEIARPVVDEAYIAWLVSLGITDPVIATTPAQTMLLDGDTASVSANTGITSPGGFNAGVTLRNDLGVPVWTGRVPVAPNGTMLFIADPTWLLNDDLTLEVVRTNPATNLASDTTVFYLMPLVTTFLGTDSVSQSTTQVIATGDLVQIRAFLQPQTLTGGLNATEIALLEGAIARLAARAALSALDQAALAAAERMVLTTLQQLPVNAVGFTAACAIIMRAFFSRAIRYVPPYNAFTNAIMRNYRELAHIVIRSYQATLAAATTPEARLLALENIARQTDRVNQINNWLAANGQVP